MSDQIRRYPHAMSGEQPFNLARHCLAAAHSTPDQVALQVFTGRAPFEVAETWSYAALEAAVLGVAAGLTRKGLQRGDKVLMRLDNTSTYPIVFLGCIAAGLVPIPTSSQLTGVESSFMLEDSGAAAMAYAPSLAATKPPAGVIALAEDDLQAMMSASGEVTYAETLADDPAYLIYTSGTTARPKGVVHAQRVIVGRTPMYQGWYGITSEDRMLHAGAFNWTYTLGTGLLDAWANGATSLIFTGEKSPDIWPALIRESGATIFAAVPGLMRQILKYADADEIDVGALRHGLIAGEKPAERLFSDWRARTGTELYEALGMSELSTYISCSLTVPRKPGTTGKVQAGRIIAILPVDGGTDPLPANSEGLIAVDRDDPGLMLGYWQRPDEEAEVFRGNWFIGGDLGQMDEDGYITHLGRANDVMKALGYRVSPQEVDAVLAQCPGVAEVACAEVRVREDVSVVGAFIVRSVDNAVTSEQVKAFAAEHLATYKCPREVVFVETLPCTANGKVKRSELALRYERERQTAS